MYLVDVNAYCNSCGWRAYTKNGMGLAAIHHKKTGHWTIVELGYVQQFGKAEVPLEQPS